MASFEWRGVVAPALLFACVAISSCDGATPERIGRVIADTLPSGMIIIRSPDAEAWPVEARWRLMEDLRVGSIDGDNPETFGHVAAIEVDELGRLFVLDAQSHEIRVFDSDGTHARTFGGRGAGPGELTQPTALTWGPEGRLWVLDVGNGRWTVFDTAGVHVTEQLRRSTSFQMPWRGVFNTEGELVDPLGSDLIVRHRPGEASVDTFSMSFPSVEEFQIRSGNTSFSARIPFAPYPIWHLDREGMIWYGDGSRYEIAHRTLEGDTVRLIRRDHTQVSVAPTDRRNALAQMGWAEGLGMEVDLGRIPGFQPAYEDFFTDDRGYLWVAVSPDIGEEFTTYSAFDVFDPEGGFLGRVESSTPLLPSVPPRVYGNYMYAVHVGELHVNYVVRLRIEGRDQDAS